MKEQAKDRVMFGRVRLTDVWQLLLVNLVFAIGGFIATKGRVTEGIYPFGFSVLGGAAPAYVLSSAAGTVLGYLLNIGEGGDFRYIAAAAGITLIRLLARGTFKGADRPAFAGFVTAVVALATGIITVKSDYTVLLRVIAEALLASGGAYFIAKSAFVLNKENAAMNTEELCCLLFSLSVVFSGLFGITAGEVSLGRILAAGFIMLSSRFGGVLSGTVTGVALGFTALLCIGRPDTLVMLSVGGALSGLFSRFGKITVLLSFLASVFVSSVVVFSENTLLYLSETAVSAGIFLLLPRTFGVKLGKYLVPKPGTDAPMGLKKSVIMRLGFAATALKDVSETVEQVARELTKVNSPEFADIFSKVEDETCKGCNLRRHCWETRRNDTVGAVMDMVKAVKRGETSPELFSSEEFRGSCFKTEEFGKSVYKHYSQYAAAIAAENRIDEVRGVVSDQFDGISSMLTDLSEELENGENYDIIAAENIASALKGIDIIADGCSCITDKYGRMNIEIRIKKSRETVINRMEIKKAVSVCCERDFDAPAVTEFGNEILVSINERAALKIDIGAEQIAGFGHNLCGDKYRYFLDGKGRLIMVLSDGMGTGGRAAVDSAMASGLMSRLLKAGFGYDCSLRILNSSMLFKSTDESLATVDIAVIDLFSGRTELLKAGAAPTLVRRSGRTGKAQSSSLPAGILRDIAFDKAVIRLKKGDIILLMSDGAVSEGTEWICAELEGWGDGTAQELSEHIAHCAKRRRTDNHEDDITVLAAIVERAV